MTKLTSHKRAMLVVMLMTLIALLMPGARLSAKPASAGAAAANFKQAACPSPLPPGMVEGQDVQCGYVTVPELHAQPSGRTIQLAVAVIKSTGSHLPDPIVLLDGGPGLSSMSSTFPLLVGPFGAPITSTGRDLVLIEQRGNFASKPNLMCPEVFDAFRQSIRDGADSDARRGLVVEAYGSCSAGLVDAGVNLAAYNSLENAADVPDVVQALGYKSYNIYGVSYGTEVAQLVMRDHPDGVRSAVLSSVIPLNRNVNAAIPESAERSFKLLFQKCAQDTACNEAYPDLQAVFARLVYRLNTAPLQVPVKLANDDAVYQRSVSGDDLVRALSEAFDADNLPGLPKAIYDIAAGRLSWLQAHVGSGEGTGTEALGMMYSVICSGGADFSESSLRTDTPVERAMAAGRPQEMLAVCADWPVEKLGELVHKPLVSDIRTMLMAGEFDIITPPPFLDVVAAGLENGHAFTYPGQGHGGIDACRLDMMLSFYADPSHAPDASCTRATGIDFELPASR